MCTVCVLELTHRHILGLQNLIFNIFVVSETLKVLSLIQGDVDFSADLGRSCLLGPGAEDVKERGGLQSNVVGSLTPVSVHF